jgi:hypothetical protein
MNLRKKGIGYLGGKRSVAADFRWIISIIFSAIRLHRFFERDFYISRNFVRLFGGGFSSCRKPAVPPALVSTHVEDLIRPLRKDSTFVDNLPVPLVADFYICSFCRKTLSIYLSMCNLCAFVVNKLSMCNLCAYVPMWLKTWRPKNLSKRGGR